MPVHSGTSNSAESRSRCRCTAAVGPGRKTTPTTTPACQRRVLRPKPTVHRAYLCAQTHSVDQLAAVHSRLQAARVETGQELRGQGHRGGRRSQVVRPRAQNACKSPPPRQTPVAAPRGRKHVPVVQEEVHTAVANSERFANWPAVPPVQTNPQSRVIDVVSHANALHT